MADVGRVLVVSCSSFLSPEDIINAMCNKKHPEPTQLSDSLTSYLWKIENKYYTADVHLCACSVSSLPPQCEFAGNMNFQSVIITFDQKEKSSFEEVASWLSYIESKDPSVLLLINSGKGELDNGGVSKAEVVKWCLDNSFELINMICEEDEKDEEEDDFREKTGIDRVIEALQCAEWPNMEMRESQSHRVTKVSSNDQEAVNKEDNSKQSSKNDGATKNPTSSLAASDKPQAFAQPTDDLELLSNLASDGAENESFEELFQKLAAMKERASSLPAEERKDYAERVAIAFWRAMGGSEDEIAGLGEDSDS
ncbi:unnamed protein product [Porites evermanni]|uniref:Alpha-and gamma-adaptin-binding protein p34 n=1 Tax=Porites evermanni TaxID=104178 RepID=A0ABN8R6M6_9CNID|nr:unnamed protein product [Porites evermanni]